MIYNIVTVFIITGLLVALCAVALTAFNIIDRYKNELAQCQSPLVIVEPGK